MNYSEHFKTWTSFILNNKLLTNQLESKILPALIKEYKEKKILPDKKNIFRAFRETGIDDVKYVLLGMDPYNNIYNNKPSACGLSFVTENGYINPSLRILCDNLGIKPSHFKHFMLSKDVLLLNSYLTVEHLKPKSHMKIWDEYTKIFISALSRYNPNITWILLGNDAKVYKENIVSGVIHTAIHPAALARKGISKYEDYKILFTELNWLNGKHI